MNPVPGEYWYYVDNYNNVQIGRVTNFDPYYGTSRVYVPLYGETYMKNSHFIRKWEPNWFWRLLGY